MNFKLLSISLSACLLATGCASTQTKQLTVQEMSLNNALNLISIHSTEKHANKSLKTVKSCKVPQGKSITIDHLELLKGVDSKQFDLCWNNVVEYMKNGDPRVKKGGKNYPIAQEFHKYWNKSSL